VQQRLRCLSKGRPALKVNLRLAIQHELSAAVHVKSAMHSVSPTSEYLLAVSAGYCLRKISFDLANKQVFWIAQYEQARIRSDHLSGNYFEIRFQRDWAGFCHPRLASISCHSNVALSAGNPSGLLIDKPDPSKELVAREAIKRYL
jgi:hypothetical protein